jgi:PAS domain S-box-containing protein
MKTTNVHPAENRSDARPVFRKAFVNLVHAELEQALHDSERSYRRLFEAAQDGILILDLASGQVDDVNPFLEQLLGFSKSEIVGKTVGELSPFKDVVANHEMLERLQKEGYVRYDDLPLQAKDGHTVAVEFVSNVYQVGSRKVIQCNIRDITIRKSADRRLSLLSASVSHLNDIVVITEALPTEEPGPKIVFVNEAFTRITGYTASEAIGRSPSFLHGEKTDPSVQSEIRHAVASQKPIRRQLINYRKDGTSYWCDIDIAPILDQAGRCSHFVAIERDITEAKRNEARFRRLMDSNAQCVMFWSTGGGISEANDAFLALVGYSRDDLHAGRINWVTLTPPEYAHFDRRALQELDDKSVCAPYEKEFICKNGARVPILIGAALLEATPEEGVSFVIDLTERRKLEKQYLRAQRMESIGTLAGGIAHDLNNILAPIMMSIEMLKSLSDDSPEAKLVLETIEVSAKRGADIVRQVLSFARGMDGERVEVQPKHLLHDLETIVRDTFPRDIQIKLFLPKDSWSIVGDPTQIHQVLLNLCVNARDAMPNGGTLIVSAENATLDDHYVAMNLQAKAGKYLRISVTDTGAGIPPAIVDKIFEPFFTTKEINKSTGLGLSTVMAIVKSHGGIMNVYSEVGKGTTFKVYFPATDSPSAPIDRSPADDILPRGNGETILVVDDEDSILLITGRTLQAFGYRVLTATNGAQAVGVYAENKHTISVILTDMMMPVMGGLALIHALRAMNPQVKIIASSGLAANGNIPEEFSLTTTNFLVKPYTAKTLLVAIRTVLAQPDCDQGAASSRAPTPESALGRA